MKLQDLQSEQGLRAGTGVAFAAALASTRLTVDNTTLGLLGLSIAAMGIPLLITSLWGERTRPKFNLGWTVLTLLVAGSFAVSMQLGGLWGTMVRLAPIAIYVGLFIFNDHPLAPSLMLTSTMLCVTIRGDIQWEFEGEARAWWVAISILIGLVAAMLERERLQSLVAVATPWTWTVVRLSFLLLWTLLILMFQQELNVGQIFASVGADPRGDEGRWFLFALILVCLAAAAVLFRTRKAPENNP